MTDVATYEEQRWYPRLLFMGAASPHRCGVCRSTPANESVWNTGEGHSGAGDDPGTTESVAKPAEGHSYESDLPELSDSGFDSSSDDDDPPDLDPESSISGGSELSDDSSDSGSDNHGPRTAGIV